MRSFAGECSRNLPTEGFLYPVHVRNPLHYTGVFETLLVERRQRTFAFGRRKAKDQ